MNRRKKMLLGVSAATLLLLSAIVIILISPSRQHMRQSTPTISNPAEAQQEIEEKIVAQYPKVIVTRADTSTKQDEQVYEVRLPPEEARDLPRLHAYMTRIYTQYHRQGYKGKFLIYMNDQVIRTVP